MVAIHKVYYYEFYYFSSAHKVFPPDPALEEAKNTKFLFKNLVLSLLA